MLLRRSGVNHYFHCLLYTSRRHVAYVPGTHFFAEGGHANTLRLNFSNSTVEQIQTGMSVLRDVIAQS